MPVTRNKVQPVLVWRACRSSAIQSGTWTSGASPSQQRLMSARMTL